MWNGDVTFGETWAVYVGKVADQSAHAHAALQVAIATAGKIDLALASGAIVSGESLVVAPLVRHQLLKADSQVILLYFDAHSPTARLLLASLHTASVGPPPQSFLNAVGLDPMGVAKRLAKLEADGIGTSGLDPRLAAALAELGNDMSGGAIERVARTVGLSAPRLRALAKTQLGLPLSQWLLWRKLEVASREIAAGGTLADSALAGGFADQAHMARTMRHMFGITPGGAAIPLRKRYVQESGGH